MENTKDLCATFIEAINPIAMKSGADRAIIYGEHEDDLANANFLMSVDSGKSVQDSYAIVAREAVRQGMLGAINVRKKSEFPRGFADMKSFVPNYSLDSIKQYEAKGDRLELVS